MKKLSSALYVIFAALLFAVGGCGGGGGGSSYSSNTGGGNAAPAGAMMITIPSGAMGKGPAAYGTNPLHVPMGSQVAWQNSDGVAHTATSDSGVWDTGTINPGATSKVVTFSTVGLFPYHCTIHGAASMSGVIIVP